MTDTVAAVRNSVVSSEYQPRVILESEKDGSFKIETGDTFSDQAKARAALEGWKVPKGFKIRADLSRVVAGIVLHPISPGG